MRVFWFCSQSQQLNNNGLDFKMLDLSHLNSSYLSRRRRRGLLGVKRWRVFME